MRIFHLCYKCMSIVNDIYNNLCAVPLFLYFIMFLAHLSTKYSVCYCDRSLYIHLYVCVSFRQQLLYKLLHWNDHGHIQCNFTGIFLSWPFTKTRSWNWPITTATTKLPTLLLYFQRSFVQVLLFGVFVLLHVLRVSFTEVEC